MLWHDLLFVAVPVSHILSEKDYCSVFYSLLHKVTGLEGFSVEKDGAVHKLIIDEVQESHSGKYKFETEDIRTEASLFVEGK